MVDLLLLTVLVMGTLVSLALYGVNRFIPNSKTLWCTEPMAFVAITGCYIVGATTASSFWPYYWDQLSTHQAAVSELFLMLIAPAAILGLAYAYLQALKKSPAIRDYTACLLAFIFSHTVWIQTHAQDFGLAYGEIIGCLAAYPVLIVAMTSLAAMQRIPKPTTLEISKHPAWSDKDNRGA